MVLAEARATAFLLDTRVSLIDTVIKGGVGGHDSFTSIC